MQSDETPQTVIFVGGRRPEPVVEQELQARGIKVQWACTVKSAADLLKSVLGKTVVMTELALADGNWRDLVERVACVATPVPIVLVSSTSTAELWWDALDCGVEDILVAPLSVSRLRQFLATHFDIAK